MDWLLGLKDEIERAINQAVPRLSREEDSGNIVMQWQNRGGNWTTLNVDGTFRN